MTPETSSEHEAASVLIGVDLSSRHIRVGTVDRSGRLLNFRREPHGVTGDNPESGRILADWLLGLARQAAAERGARVEAIGVGFPGLVHCATHRIVRLPNTPALAEIDLYREFTEAFGVPVAFENNTNAAAAAEMALGVARGVNDWLYVRIGYGVGAGLVLDGKLRRGKSGFAGEIGHLNIDPEGVECACGSLGCLETIASAPNIVRRTKARLRRDSTSSLSRLFERGDFNYDDILTAAHSGDDLARMMMQRTGHFIGMAVADMINVLNLSMVAIGGNPAARPLLVPAIAEEARRRAFDEAMADCEIVAAQLGEEAGVIGAALLAHQLVRG
jgi:glucokinase